MKWFKQQKPTHTKATNKLFGLFDALKPIRLVKEAIATVPAEFRVEALREVEWMAEMLKSFTGLTTLPRPTAEYVVWSTSVIGAPCVWKLRLIASLMPVPKGVPTHA